MLSFCSSTVGSGVHSSSSGGQAMLLQSCPNSLFWAHTNDTWTQKLRQGGLGANRFSSSIALLVSSLYKQEFVYIKFSLPQNKHKYCMTISLHSGVSRKDLPFPNISSDNLLPKSSKTVQVIFVLIWAGSYFSCTILLFNDLQTSRFEHFGQTSRSAPANSRVPLVGLLFLW